MSHAVLIHRSAHWLPQSWDGHVEKAQLQEPLLLPSAGSDDYVIKEKSQVIQRNPHWVSHCGQRGLPGLWDMLGAQVTIPR